MRHNTACCCEAFTMSLPLLFAFVLFNKSKQNIPWGMLELMNKFASWKFLSEPNPLPTGHPGYIIRLALGSFLIPSWPGKVRNRRYYMSHAVMAESKDAAASRVWNRERKGGCCRDGASLNAHVFRGIWSPFPVLQSGQSGFEYAWGQHIPMKFHPMQPSISKCCLIRVERTACRVTKVCSMTLLTDRALFSTGGTQYVYNIC